VEASRAPAADLITGLTLEVRDVAAARRFYEAALAGAGRWAESAQTAVVESAGQRIELVRRVRPRASGDRGYHVGLRVPRERLAAVVETLGAMGCTVDRWREDHPAEREPSPFVVDPSGNLVQLVLSDDTDSLILDHLTMPFDDVEAADLFYRVALGGMLDHYFGWRMADVHEARRADERAAPWTRLTKFSRVQQNTQTNPIPQRFLRFGATRLGLFVATKHIQEPPEDLISGTPRILLRTPAAVDDVQAHLSSVDVTTSSTALRVRGVRFKREGDRFLLRDPSGNFVVLQCAR
jgi:hypothetical protein